MPPHIYHSTYTPLPPDPLPTNLSLPEFFSHYNPDNVPPTKPVHTDTLTARNLTYGSLRSLSSIYAYGLRYTFGLNEGETLMAMGPNTTDFVLLAHSTWWCGGVFSPLNPASSVGDIGRAVGIVRPRVVCVAVDVLGKVREALRSVGMGEGVRLCTINQRASSDSNEKLLLFPDDLPSNPTSSLPPYSLTLARKSSKETPAFIAFSSGTTGPLKAVALSHSGTIANTLQLRASVPVLLHAGAREVFFPPYCHVYGLCSIIIYGMWVGSFTCAMPSFDLEQFCGLMAEHRATWAHIVPPIAVALANSPVPLKHDLGALKVVVISAAPTKKALARKLQSRFEGVRILQGYGLTECGPSVMHQNQWDGGAEAENVGCAGRLLSGTEARLVDPETGRDVGVGEEGELWVCGPQVMIGYVRDEAATERTVVWEDGKRWLRTGDILRCDRRGDWYVTDRLKEMIKYKGFQVAPSELEDLLLKHDDVIDAAVCSVYDEEQATELPVAYVSLAEGKLRLADGEKRMVLEGIRQWIDEQVAGYKKLRGGVHHLQELPKTPSGKILRRELPVKRREGRTGKL